jgi:heme o synthase
MKGEARIPEAAAADLPIRMPGTPDIDAMASSGYETPVSRLQALAELTKFKLVMASTLSTSTGYVLFLGRIAAGIIPVSLGVLFLALGSCALNQFQDRSYDARMHRTCRRPLPSGRLTPGVALVIAAVFITAGFNILWLAAGFTIAMLGLSAVLCYNGFYTYLKRVWPFAAVPGAIIGALPPVIGWAAAGGSILDPRILAIAFLFFIWQAPHFWLLLFIFGKEYEEAGLPALTRLFSRRQLATEKKDIPCGCRQRRCHDKFELGQLSQCLQPRCRRLISA